MGRNAMQDLSNEEYLKNLIENAKRPDTPHPCQRHSLDLLEKIQNNQFELSALLDTELKYLLESKSTPMVCFREQFHQKINDEVNRRFHNTTAENSTKKHCCTLI